MKYFVTGATCFIGGQVIRQLTETGHEIVALVRDPGKAGVAGGTANAWTRNAKLHVILLRLRSQIGENGRQHRQRSAHGSERYGGCLIAPPA